jgi:hypothetical protein
MHIREVSLTSSRPKQNNSEKKKRAKSEKWDEKKKKRGNSPNGASSISLEQMEASLRVPSRTQA